ncbi:hypothetical protein JXD38_05095, partial [candidate division WOR-3 bacterium]|nr:hypothetical protein [candidate division WOR-3 bacterium]
MSRCMVGIGGTGARVLESFVHLCAMGLGPDRVRLLVVDQDRGNGNVNRLEETVKQYRKIRGDFGLGALPRPSLFSTDIELSHDAQGAEIISWEPVPNGGGTSLREYFGYADLANTESTRHLADLCDFLYSDKEMDLKWGGGFRGRPSVGAPAMARIRDQITEAPWSDIVRDLQDGCGTEKQARFFVCGSVFGAAGAAGFPTIARVIRNDSMKWDGAANLHIGGAPLLPYFGYPMPNPPPTDRDFADPRGFALNAKAALHYYANAWDAEQVYDAVYLLGNQELDGQDKPFEPDGLPQKNPAHFIEMHAALAAADFLNRGHEDQPGSTKQYHVGRARLTSVSWQDVPGNVLRFTMKDYPDFQKALLSFAVFSFSFLAFYDMLLGRDIERQRCALPW